MSKTVVILWCILSFIFSGLFIFYGLMLFQLKELTTVDFLSAVASLIYGVAAIFLLAQSWTKPGEIYVTILKYAVLIMFGIQLVLNIVISGRLEILTLTIVAVMLGSNLLAVKFVTEFRKQAVNSL